MTAYLFFLRLARFSKAVWSFCFVLGVRLAAIVFVVLIPAGAGAQSLSGVHIGDNVRVTSRIGISPSTQNEIGPQTMLKWTFPDQNELSVTYLTATGRIEYIESDWGGDSRGSLSDFPNVTFGTTTLADLRKKFGSNGVSFEKSPDGSDANGIFTSNSYEIVNTSVVVTFVTVIAALESLQHHSEGPNATANYMKVDAIMLADDTYLRKFWGKITADPAYRKIYWK